MMIEPLDSPNWYWRKPHLDIVTDNGRCIKVKDIIEHIKTNYSKLIQGVEETDTSRPFKKNHNYDMRFWHSGNNFFIYNVAYEFRKNVTAYHDADNYIANKQLPILYSAEYYESLKMMSETEINKFLCSNLIEVHKNSCISGKHRVFAMIGRLVKDKSYIPIIAYIKK